MIHCKRIILRKKGEVSVIELESITHIVADSYICTIYTEDEQHAISKLLKDFENELTDYGFVRISRNILVNTLYIKAITGGETRKICLKNNVQLKVSRRKMWIIRKFFSEKQE